MVFKIATSNTENLFSRARILNLESNDNSAALLADVSELEQLLRNDPYSADDKLCIAELFVGLNEYIDIQEDRGKLFGANNKVTATGAGDWDGDIVFKMAHFSDEQRKSISQVLSTVRADVQRLVEIEGLDVLRRFNTDFRPASPFRSSSTG